MNDMAAAARSAAMSCEAKKDGLQQQQSGEWKLNLKIHASDVPEALLTAPMGTRYQLAIVEIADDETPVNHNDGGSADTRSDSGEPSDNHEPDTSATGENPVSANSHRLSQQAALCCREGRFGKFLKTFGHTNNITTNQRAAVVRFLCDVKSRAEFDTDPAAAQRWRELHAEYQVWLRS